MILRVLVGFLLGFILGVAGTVFLVTSGAGNYVIAANPRVQEMESKIRELEDQRSFMTRRLEEVADVTERMATRFEQLSDRYFAIEAARLGLPPPPATAEASPAAPAATVRPRAVATPAPRRTTVGAPSPRRTPPGDTH